MSSFTKEFEKTEDEFQNTFDEIKLPPYHPCVVLTVELLQFRNISKGWMRDGIDTSDPQFCLNCPIIKRGHLKSFKTRSIPNNVTEGNVGESFKYVIPQYFPPDAVLSIEIELLDRNHVFDSVIGKQSVDASKLTTDGPAETITVSFGKNNGDLDIKLRKTTQKSPDFRYSVGLSPEERAFRKKRIPIVCDAMKKVLGKNGPKNVMETPIVSLIGSGGGYRALVGMCGAMEALKDAGLLDIFTYHCGLSGSSWYFLSSYALRGVKASEQNDFHQTLRERLKTSLVLDLVNPFTIHAYRNYLQNGITKHDQPHTLVNYFPGFLVGKQLLDKQMEMTLTDIIPYLESAEVPYPVLVALHVKNEIKASDYHAFVERTPFEISLPSYGINVKPSDEGSTWASGVLVRKCPEFPIHFTIAVTGCAFSVLLNAYLTHGNELGEDHLKYMETEEEKGGKNVDHVLKRNEVIESSSEVEEDNEESDKMDVLEATEPSKEDKQSSTLKIVNKADNGLHSTLMDFLKNTSFFNSRLGIVGRTALLYNFALGLEKIERFLLNPFHSEEPSDEEATDILENLGVEEGQNPTFTKNNYLMFADAGLLNNVPTGVMLRPQRTTDVMIVMDFTGYESDSCYHYQPLISTAKQARESGLQFPKIDFEKIQNMPPEEFMLFPSDGPSCPTVLWFTLCNSKFKNDQQYKPKTTAQPPDEESKKFNDFNVFGEDTPFSTFNFQYDNYHFDQLKELMYYNVINHVTEIKDALVKSIALKRQQRAESKL